MRNAYALLGVAFIIIIGAALFLSSKSSPDEQKIMLTLSSPAFITGESIPSKYTCDADNISPELHILNIPAGTKSLVLLMDDPDVPKALKPDGVFDHWVLYAIPPDTRTIPEGGLVGNAGANGRGQSAYTGPCPPPQYEPSEHRYFFRLYAIDTDINFIKIPTKADMLSAIQGHIIEQAELVGKYRRVVP